MSWSIFKKTIIFFVPYILISPQLIASLNRDDNQIEKHQKKRSVFIPRYSKLQYAGSMGLFSAGVGWDYGKNKQWETDVYLGFLPKYSTRRAKVTFTLRENFIPWKKNINKSFMLEPLACGIYLNTIFDKDFWVKEPSKYPNSYYKFSTKIRINVYVGQRLTFNGFKSQNKILSHPITFFYEISSNDIYIRSAVESRYIRPKDYLHLSLGLKWDFF